MLISNTLGPVNRSMGMGGIGDLAFRQGDYEQARAYYEALLHLTTDNGYRAWTHAHLGHVLLRQGDSVGSRQRFEQALQRFNGSGWKIGVIYTVEGLASLEVVQTQLKRAVLLLGWAEAIRKEIDNRRPPVEQADIDFVLSKIRAGMDDDSFHTAWAEGQTLTIEQAVTLALGQNG